MAIKEYEVTNEIHLDVRGNSTVCIPGTVVKCDETFAAMYPWALHELKTDRPQEVTRVEVESEEPEVEIPDTEAVQKMKRGPLNELAESLGIDPTEHRKIGDLRAAIEQAR